MLGERKRGRWPETLKASWQPSNASHRYITIAPCGRTINCSHFRALDLLYELQLSSRQRVLLSPTRYVVFPLAFACQDVFSFLSFDQPFMLPCGLYCVWYSLLDVVHSDPPFRCSPAHTSSE